MARIIPTYDAPALDIRPSQEGVDALQQGARRIGAFYNQAGQDMAEIGARGGSAIKSAGDAAVQQIEHHEVNNGAKNYAALFDNLTTEWNARVSDAAKTNPNDPAVAQKFREDVLEPALQKFSEQWFNTEGGQKFADSHANALREHFFQKTTADMSTLAGIAVKQNTAETINRLSSTVQRDPSALDMALSTADTSLGAIVDSSPNLKGTAGAAVRMEVLQKARESIVKSAVIGMIEKNPDVDLGAIQKKYGDYINGPEMVMFQKAAKAQARANAYYEKQTEVAAKQQADLAVSKGLNDVINTSVSVDPNNPSKLLIAPDAMKKVLDVVRKNPDAPNAAAHARTTLDWFEHQQAEKPTQTDPATKTALYNGMFSPDKPTADTDIYKAEVEGKLSRGDAQSLLQLNKALTEEPLRGPIYQDTMKAVQGELVLSGVGLPGKDIQGEANYAKFIQTFVPQYLAAKRAGTLQPNALDVKDPKSMISQAMAPFKRTVTDRMKDYVSVLGSTNLSDQNITGVSVEAPKPAPALPPKDKLEAGKRYTVPGRGEMTWTGTGFVR